MKRGVREQLRRHKDRMRTARAEALRSARTIYDLLPIYIDVAERINADPRQIFDLRLLRRSVEEFLTGPRDDPTLLAAALRAAGMPPDWSGAMS